MVGQITGEMIKSSVALAIRDFFKTNTGGTTKYPTIYKEQIVQGYDKPSFFIWTIDVSWDKVGFNKYNILHQMNIRYQVDEDTEDKYEILIDTATKLCDCLETIQVPISLDGIKEVLRPVRGKDIEFKIQDDVLQFYINYDIRAIRGEGENNPMQVNEVNTQLK